MRKVLASTQFEMVPRHAAAIYFKHFVLKSWRDLFTDAERQLVCLWPIQTLRCLQVRDNLVDAAVRIDVQSIRTQLALVMSHIAEVSCVRDRS